ncbi:E3 ubiquitin-protein ligase TRIM15-like [Alligator mississippiensis]|nr:E3 ubiquitin-protein ligase TRIM15-like [Alligator mississippiensis]
MQFQFERLHQFLEKQERLFLAWLEELERDIETRKDESITQLSEKLSCLDALLRELEEKCEEPAMGFLEDARSTLNRCETERAWPSALSCPETNWRIWLFSQNITFLQEALEKLQGNMETESLKRSVSVCAGAVLMMIALKLDANSQ